jgi:hypothetical protein
MKKKKSKGEAKIGLVFCVYPEQYEIFDTRISKPICIKKIEGGIEVGSMVYQELDQLSFKKKSLLYFPPNNVGILLSISTRFFNDAKLIFENKIDPNKFDHSLDNAKGDRKKYLMEKSRIVCDFIESIQTSIVFSYTALEAFCNLSIPEDYEYKTEIRNKGIIEVYDKKAIERWIPLQQKLCKILPEIYQTKKLENQKFWSYYVKLEKYRDDIIHQKSIERTEFYKNYFRKDIFDVCESGKEIIKFFYEQHSEKNKTNALWPWLINSRKEFPLRTDFKSENFEVVGNLYEGIKK